MQATRKDRARGWWPLLLAGGLALCPIAQAGADPVSWPYFQRVNEAEERVGAPAVFVQLEAMKPEQRAALLEEKRGDLDMLMNMRSVSGDAVGAAQAAVWFEIANGKPDRFAADSGKPLDAAAAEDALQAIVREARNRQIVILNEAHHIPVHRVFAARLAAELKKIGFEYLAAEAFEKDIAPQARTVMKDMGFYAMEPMYAGFLRHAMRDGWTFVTYDNGPMDPDPERRERLREISAADKIVEKVFAKNPKARLFMYVGYGHANKDPLAREGGWKSVATLLREKLGIEPLTIDQTTMYGRGDVRTDHPQYRLAMQRFAPSRPVVLKSAAGGYAMVGIKAGAYDMQVFHPDETRLTQHGRPLWMQTQAGLKPQPVPSGLLPASGRRLIQAFHAGDGPGAVPADQVLVEAGKPAPAFMLPEGQFRYGYEE